MLLLLLALIPDAHAACEERDGAILEAEAAVVEFRLDDAEQALGRAEDALACGAIQTDTLARWWLAEAVWLQLAGETEDAAVSFAAVSRVDNEFWNTDYGPEMRKIYENAWRQLEGTGSIVLVPPPTTYIATLNGLPAGFPADVDAGLHLVQAGPTFRNLTFSKVLFVEPGATAHVETGLGPQEGDEPAGPVAPPPAVPAPRSTGDGGVRLHAGLGGVVALGTKLADKDVYGFVEPGAKMNVPVEFGASVVTDTLWLRAAFVASPLLGGQYLWDNGDGPQQAGVGLGGHGGVGLVLGQAEAGLLVGGLFPGRLSFHGAGSVPLGSAPLRFEGRLGVNVATGGRVEGVLGAMLAFTPTL